MEVYLKTHPNFKLGGLIQLYQFDRHDFDYEIINFIKKDFNYFIYF